MYSLIITISSAALILVCTSMAAWYISRVNSVIARAIYYICVFSMVVPFQMVMFTLAKTANVLHLDTPFTIPIVYLGFGAGLAVFMFAGFVKGIPLEIEEAAAIDGCGPLRTFFLIVFPMLKPVMISVGVLEIMWIWNDYLLPYLVLNRTLYKTIPIHIQYLQGSYGHVDLGRGDGADRHQHPAHHHLLPHLPEVHYQGCHSGCGERIIPVFAIRAGFARRRDDFTCPLGETRYNKAKFKISSGAHMKRSSGILMHISSLPSPYGIGTFGREAYAFVDKLVCARQRYWQVLPLGPTSYGDSPYQSFSAFAGNPYFIDLDLLTDEGLLERSYVASLDWGCDARMVDYGVVF